jgi:G:T-mismatch repair DNA endonuclease (very short patch repair protein)
VFVDGCFWHQHGCRLSHIPASRLEYWGPKLARTRQRDEVNRQHLARIGWCVLTVWECETRDVQRLAALIAEVRHTPVRRTSKPPLSSLHGAGARGVRQRANRPASR